MLFTIMGSNIIEIKICLLAVSSFIGLYFLNRCFLSNVPLKDVDHDYVWFLRLCVNIFSYSTVFVPGYLAYRYIKRSKYLENADAGWFPLAVRLCLGENDDISQNPLVSTSADAIAYHRSSAQEAILLLLCFLGLQAFYLSWGVLQEKVMTKDYVNEAGEKSHFKDSQFLVLVNRILAFCMAGTVLLFTRQPRHKAPLHKYVFCSFSNILSSWCQYEALKYVSFPNQVLAKAGKVIPVMIMSKIVSRTKYEYYEYVTAVILSFGMIFFMLDTGDDRKGSVTTVSGLILLASYILFDSFTSNWQSALFKSYGMSSVQMMCAVNLFSCLFTAISLLQQDGFITSIYFMFKFPRFVFDCLLLSICSAIGQLIIFYTIATFGAVIFVIIMTVRQGLAILLSCLIYQHHISSTGIFGVCLVFIGVFLRIYCNQRVRWKSKKRAQMAARMKV